MRNRTSHHRILSRVQYRKEQLKLQEEEKQKARELAIEQENEKQRRLDKLRAQACGSAVVSFSDFRMKIKKWSSQVK